jgi:hypothetical protein
MFPVYKMLSNLPSHLASTELYREDGSAVQDHPSSSPPPAASGLSGEIDFIVFFLL